MLTKREIEIVKCLLQAWDENSHGLYGHLSYNDVFEFCDKLGIAHPPNLVEFIEKAEAEIIARRFMGSSDNETV